MKKFLRILSTAVGLHSLLVTYHKSRLLAAAEAMKRFGTETMMPVWCSRRYRRHHQALLRLGFVVRKEFAVERRTISGPDRFRAFGQLLRVRFPDCYWTCAPSGTRVIVIAPPAQMPEWQRFLCEYDQVAS